MRKGRWESEHKCWAKGKEGERVNVQMPEGWTVRSVLTRDKLPLLYLISVGTPTGDCQHSLSWGNLEQIP